jgi:hypothetical protein
MQRTPVLLQMAPQPFSSACFLVYSWKLLLQEKERQGSINQSENITRTQPAPARIKPYDLPAKRSVGYICVLCMK